MTLAVKDQHEGGRAVAEYLADIDFPTRKGRLIAAAIAHHAPTAVIDILERIPSEWILTSEDLPALPP